MSTNTIILLILGVVILVVLILGFTMGWGKIAPWISSNNVDTIVTQCGIACSTNANFDFCTQKRTLNDGENPKFDVTCDALSKDDDTTDYEKYGIEKCPAITCDSESVA